MKQLVLQRNDGFERSRIPLVCQLYQTVDDQYEAIREIRSKREEDVGSPLSHIGLTTESAVGTDFARHARHFAGEASLHDGRVPVLAMIPPPIDQTLRFLKGCLSYW
jgi:hypothetical protein